MVIIPNSPSGLAFQEAAMRTAVEHARKGSMSGAGGPFGASIYKGSKLVAAAHNNVICKHDCTCHAEIECLRLACAALQAKNLSDCVIYTTAEPCPMCFGALQTSRIGGIVVGIDRHASAVYGFDDSEFYLQLSLPYRKRKIPIYGNILRNECMQECLNKLAENDFPPDTEVTDDIRRFMNQAIALYQVAVKSNDDTCLHSYPQAVLVVKDGAIIGLGVSRMDSDKDVTNTAGMRAIRQACMVLGTHYLVGCTLYSTLELSFTECAAAMWSRVEAIYFAVSLKDLSIFNDLESTKPETVVSFGILSDECENVFRDWKAANMPLY